MAKENKYFIKGISGSYKFCEKGVSGVYIIMNDKTGEFYIGSSIDINRRMSHHFGSLKNNNNNCQRLQDNFNTFSYEDFSFYVLYKGEESFIREKELELLHDNYDNPLLLNTAIDNNWVDIRNEMKVINYKKKLSQHASMRTKDKNSFYGKRHNEKTKEKLRILHTGKENKSCHKAIVINGCFYKSLNQATEILGVPIATISHRVRSSNPLFVNWYDYEEVKEINLIDERLLFNVKSNPSGLYEVEGKLYTDKKEITNKYNLKSSTFNYRLRSESFPNWKRLI